MEYSAPTIFIINPDPFHYDPDRNFIDAVSDIHPVRTVSEKPYSELEKYVYLWYGRILIDNPEMMIAFISKSGQQRLDIVLPQILEKPASDSILGYVILADSKYVTRINEIIALADNKKAAEIREKGDPSGFEDWFYVPLAKEEIRIFKEIVPDEPFVVAVINQDTPNAMPLDKLRGELDLDDDVKLIPCDPQNRADVKHVLLELLAIAEPTPAVEQAINTITKL